MFIICGYDKVNMYKYVYVYLCGERLISGNIWISGERERLQGSHRLGKSGKNENKIPGLEKSGNL